MARKLKWEINFFIPKSWNNTEKKSIEDTCESKGEIFKLKHAQIIVTGLDAGKPEEKIVVSRLALLTDKDNRDYVYLKDESRKGDKNHWVKQNGLFPKKVRNAFGTQIIAQYNKQYDTKFVYKEDQREWAGVVSKSMEKQVEGLEISI